MKSSRGETSQVGWVLRGDELSLRSTDGTLIIPSAEEIFRCEFEGETRIGGHLVEEIPAGLGRLRFSMLPVEFRLGLETSPETPLLCRVVAEVEGRDVEIREPLTRKSDHAVLAGTWYPFRRGALDEVRSVLAQANVRVPGAITLGQYLNLAKLADSNPFVKDLTSNAAERLKLLPAADAEPPGFEGHLYPYQSTGYQWLKLVSGEGLGCILADEMGLGKTPQVIALFLAEKAAKPTSASLVVAPATILANWERELAKFAPPLKVRVHRGATRTGFPSELKESDVVITSYDTAVRDHSLLRMISWNVVVLDEAQAVKTPNTRRSQSMKRLPRRIGIAVTGTPLENRLTDIWSLMDFSIPGYLGTLAEFQSSYEIDPSGGARRLEPLVSPLMLRRRVAEVKADLPPRIEIPQPLELTPRGAREYDRLRQEIREEYGNAATLVSLTKLREYCGHPQLTQDIPAQDPLENSPKYERLVEILKEIFSNDDKALVFTSFNQMVDIIVRDIARRTGVYADWIDGRVPGADRQPKIDRFYSATGPGVLIMNPRTGGLGLNITAANHVIHYTLEWNPAVEDQASARAHRLGQVKPVTVHRLFYLGTVEEVVNDRLVRKRDLSARAVVGNPGDLDGRADILRALAASPIGIASR